MDRGRFGFGLFMIAIIGGLLLFLMKYGAEIKITPSIVTILVISHALTIFFTREFLYKEKLNPYHRNYNNNDLSWLQPEKLDGYEWLDPEDRYHPEERSQDEKYEKDENEEDDEDHQPA